MLTTLYVLSNFIYTISPRDQLYNYLYFIDEKLRFRLVKFLAGGCGNQLTSKPAPFPFARCQQRWMLGWVGFFLIRSRMRTRKKRERVSHKGELKILKRSFILRFCPSTYFGIEWFFFDNIMVLICGLKKKNLAIEKIFNLVFVTNIKHVLIGP